MSNTNDTGSIFRIDLASSSDHDVELTTGAGAVRMRNTVDTVAFRKMACYFLQHGKHAFVYVVWYADVCSMVRRRMQRAIHTYAAVCSVV